MPITVAIVEDDAGIRNSLAVLVNGTEGLCCTGAYPSAEIALKQIPLQWPDVVVMDINLPALSGIECVARLKAMRPSLEVLMLTVDDGSMPIFQSLQAGANGYLVKGAPPTEILAAITEVFRGGSPMSTPIARRVVQHFQHNKPTTAPTQLDTLSKREIEVVTCLAKGYRYKEIADTLAITPNTVRSHIRRIYEKLQVTSRTEAAVKLTQRGSDPGI